MKMRSGNHQLLEDDRWKMKGGAIPPKRSEPIPCPNCKGSGRVESTKKYFTYWDEFLEQVVTDYEEDTECPVCQGLGEVDVEKK